MKEGWKRNVEMRLGGAEKVDLDLVGGKRSVEMKAEEEVGLGGEGRGKVEIEGKGRS